MQARKPSLARLSDALPCFEPLTVKPLEVEAATALETRENRSLLAVLGHVCDLRYSTAQPLAVPTRAHRRRRYVDQVRDVRQDNGRSRTVCGHAFVLPGFTTAEHAIPDSRRRGGRSRSGPRHPTEDRAKPHFKDPRSNHSILTTDPIPHLAPSPDVARVAMTSASVRTLPRARRLNVSLDEHTDEILRRFAKPGREAAYVRAAVLEKAARDECRGELDELRARVEQLEQQLGEQP